jgi:PIN domain nuclease of toxin-antitoxin system
MSDVILDASAILAVIKGEPGIERAGGVIRGARVSALIVAEVATWFAHQGMSAFEINTTIDDFNFRTEPFDDARARATGILVSKTRSRGLSLADRACLALALELGLPVLTADRAWVGLDIGVDVRLIR